MVKAYLRYEHTGSFGVIAGAGALAYDPKTNLLAAAALEDIAVWNVKQASLVSICNSVDSLHLRGMREPFLAGLLCACTSQIAMLSVVKPMHSLRHATAG